MTAIERVFFTSNSIEILCNVNTYSRAHMPIYCVLIHYILIQKKSLCAYYTVRHCHKCVNNLSHHNDNK